MVDRGVRRDFMGLFCKLFGGGQAKRQSTPVNQPEGFYIVRYDFGEAQARTLFQRANAGDVSAQLTIAKCFMDAAEQPYALPWYERAAAAGNSKAIHELTYFYEGRYVGIPADSVKAERVRSMALRMNNPEAFVKIGSQYFTGDGVEKDKVKAFNYYMKAAELGSSEGMTEVGLCYLNGDGVKQDGSKAFEWLSRSKDERYRSYPLAQCYLKGIGTVQNVEKGVFYLEKAVELKCLELNEAQRQLVDLYSKGYGGSNSSAKLQRLKADMAESSRLMDELARLLMSENN